MKSTQLTFVLTAINLVLPGMLLAGIHPLQAQATPPVLRGEALEIVDRNGMVRARINIEPGGKAADGSVYPESVVLRLTDPDGRIRVKLGANADGSGLVLADNTQQPGVHILADVAGSFLKVMNQDGREQTVRP
jgi:hypothetical protein